MRIPFRSLRFKEGSDTWGINFRRLVRGTNESTFLTPIPRSFGRRGMTKVSSAGTLVGLETPPKLRNFDLKPYALGSAITNRLATPPIDNDLHGEFGVDAKWAITQSLVTDFTYNTDFAQVEDDEAQVNLTRFSLFFPEKREFFLEGAGVLQLRRRQLRWRRWRRRRWRWRWRWRRWRWGWGQQQPGAARLLQPAHRIEQRLCRCLSLAARALLGKSRRIPGGRLADADGGLRRGDRAGD